MFREMRPRSNSSYLMRLAGRGGEPGGSAILTLRRWVLVLVAGGVSLKSQLGTGENVREGANKACPLRRFTQVTCSVGQLKGSSFRGSEVFRVASPLQI